MDLEYSPHYETSSTSYRPPTPNGVVDLHRTVYLSRTDVEVKVELWFEVMFEVPVQPSFEVKVEVRFKYWVGFWFERWFETRVEQRVEGLKGLGFTASNKLVRYAHLSFGRLSRYALKINISFPSLSFWVVAPSFIVKRGLKIASVYICLTGTPEKVTCLAKPPSQILTTITELTILRTTLTAELTFHCEEINSKC